MSIELKEGMNRIPCTACAIADPQHRKYCPECRGVGYTEHFVESEGCTGEYPACPIEEEYAVGGWLCTKCGRSGPD